tara:strand:+ start:476 stop:601 length:126 start_codon:yes stop_codon:yes gene_type:complete
MTLAGRLRCWRGQALPYRVVINSRSVLLGLQNPYGAMPALM